MRYTLTDRAGRKLGTLELEATQREFWRAMQRLQVQMQPAPVTPVVAVASKPRKRKPDDAT